MITRFDHAVIAVRDLDSAIARYRTLGFDVTRGGRHLGRGTHNAIIRFGLDYIELISIYDATEALAQGARGQVLTGFLQDHSGGCLGYSVASSAIEEEARRFEGTPLHRPPFSMQRARPDGHVLAWRLFVPGGVAWRRPWPFLIQWEQSDSDRLSWEQPGAHANGALRVARLSILTNSLADTSNLYDERLALKRAHGGKPARDVLQTAWEIAGVVIEVIQPVAGPAQMALADAGEGLFEIGLAVADIERARRALISAGITPQERRGSLAIPSDAALGARLVLETA